jgi:hypothetical protein
MSRHYWLSAAFVVGAALVASTACGSQHSPPTTSPTTTTTVTPGALISEMVSACQNASGVHIKGSVTGSGGKVSMDLQLNKDGDASGLLNEQGRDMDIISTKGVVYVKLTAGVMQASGIDPSSVEGQLLLNKWVASTSDVMPGGGLVSGAKSLLDYNTFFQGMTQQIPADAAKAGRTDIVNGTPVQRYTFSDGSTFDIATSSPHYLMRLITVAKDGAGQVDFTGWNQPVAVSAPPAGDIYSGPAA